MFCTRCGQPVAQGSVFCSHCGQALSAPAEPQPPVMPGPEWQPPVYPERPETPPQGYYAPPAYPGYGQPQYQKEPRQKKRTGLVVGLSVGGAFLLLIVLMLLFVWPGFLSTVPVAGIWYSESRGEAIVFGAGNSFDAYTYYGDFDGDYDYNEASGKGHIEMSDNRAFDFTVVKGTLYVDDMGMFTKADNRFDIDDFIKQAVKEFGTEGSGS